MKIKLRSPLVFAPLLLVALALIAVGAFAASNIDPVAKYAWSENAGWLNANPAGGSGVNVSGTALSGYIWGENIGWINTNCTTNATCGTVSYGVVNDGVGRLSGYAWSENKGWINFSCTTNSTCGGPAGAWGVRINTLGEFTGRAWGENAGWISFNCTNNPPSCPGTGGYQVRSSYVPLRDHKTDANGDGYSDADEYTAANCGVASCSNITTFGTAETPACKDSASNCGAPGAPADDNVPVRVAPPPATGYGCSKTLDIVGPKTTVNLAKSDVDLDGVVSILDLSVVAGWFNNTINPSPTDPRWEGDMDGDGVISILDLSAMADNFNRSVAGNCKVE